MRTTRIAVAAAALAVALPLATAAKAQELVMPSLTYRTGPYAPNGIPLADAWMDYFTLLNERDGGINGVPVKVVECETAYDTTKGVECYESLKGQNPMVIHPYSTGITYQIIPKAAADEIPIHSMGYGRTSAADGTVFPWVFNFPGTYWDAASVIVKHIMEQEGGSLDGKKISLVYHNSAYGKEPIRTLEKLAEKHGFELALLPVDHPGQEQASTWLQIRRDRPDYVVMWGWGVMNQVAIKEAASIRFPMDKFIGVWWSGSEQDVIPAGASADGYKAITMHDTGTEFPVYEDLKKYVFDAGKASGDGSHAGTVLYNRNLLAAMFAAEAAKTAMEIHGTKEITPAMMRDGFENLELTEEKLAELGFGGFIPPFKVTCQNHGAPGRGAIQQWDADTGTWSLITDFIEADREVVDPLIAEDAAAYAKEANITPRTCG